MRRGLLDQHLFDHPGLDPWYHPRDVRVIPSPKIFAPASLTRLNSYIIFKY